MTSLSRCAWAGNELMIRYHDQEWGVPMHDDQALFEFLILEGAQAGLAWITILRKREGYHRAFEGFDPRRLAGWGEPEVERLLAILPTVAAGTSRQRHYGNVRWRTALVLGVTSIAGAATPSRLVT